MAGQDKDDDRKGGGILLPGSAAAGAKSAGGGFLSLLFGKLGLLAALLGAGGVALVVLGLKSGGRSASQQASADGPSLSPLQATVPVRKRDPVGSRSLHFVQQALDGGAPPPAAADAPPAAEGPVQDGAASPEAAFTAEAMSQLAAARGGAGSLEKHPGLGADGGGSGGGSGAGSSAGAGPGAGVRSGGAGADPASSGQTASLAAAGGRAGKLSSMRNMKPTLAQKRLAQGNRSRNAFGQLKFSSGQSKQAALSGSAESQASYAAGAFDQLKTQGGGVDGVGSAGNAGGGGGGGAPSLGSGAPAVDNKNTDPSNACPSDWSTDDTGVCAPASIGGADVSPCKDTAEQVSKMYMAAGIMAAVGIVLVLLGLKLLATGWGALILIGGVALLATAGLIWLSASQTSKASEEQCGGTVSSQAGLLYTECTGAADYCKPLMNGTDPNRLKSYDTCMKAYREKNCRKL